MLYWFNVSQKAKLKSIPQMFNEYLLALGTQRQIILVSDVFILTTQHLHCLQSL